MERHHDFSLVSCHGHETGEVSLSWSHHVENDLPNRNVLEHNKFLKHGEACHH
jgi:hypothetical protein